MDIVNLDRVKKRFKKIPQYVHAHLIKWAERVNMEGIRKIRKIPGYHDEPLKGKRKGKRSIRLTRSWRAIYREEKDGIINLIIVEEVNKHEY